MKLIQIPETRGGTTWKRLGKRQDQLLFHLKVPKVMAAARIEPVKKKALNKLPNLARSLG